MPRKTLQPCATFPDEATYKGITEVKALADDGENLSEGISNLNHTLEEQTKELENIHEVNEFILGQM